MPDQYSSNPKKNSKKRFAKLEAQVSNISRNMAILLSILESKFKPYRELGISNSNIGSNSNLKIKKS
jgi:hypothetical protein